MSLRNSLFYSAQMMTGYLRASGLQIQRHRIRQSLKRVEQLGSAERWSRAVTRRTYNVPTPNSLWHLDSHMKLVRYAYIDFSDIKGIIFRGIIFSSLPRRTVNSMYLADNTGIR